MTPLGFAEEVKSEVNDGGEKVGYGSDGGAVSAVGEEGEGADTR